MFVTMPKILCIKPNKKAMKITFYLGNAFIHYNTKVIKKRNLYPQMKKDVS